MACDVIRVVVADDNQAVRYGLGVVLDLYDDIELVGQAENGFEALDLCEQLQPDLVLMDLMMPKMDGVTATKLIHERFPDIRVVVLSSGGDSELVASALSAGAENYLEKHTNIDALVEAIRPDSSE
jgi:two-component system, NarL family, response regulator LiaR